MKKTLFMTCAAALAVLTLANNVQADPVTWAGVHEHGKRESLVIQAALEYEMFKYEHGFSRGINTIEEARQRVKDAVLKHPEQINDCIYNAGSALNCGMPDDFALTALWVAAYFNDTELVLFLLEHGAYPFLPEDEHMYYIIAKSTTDYKLKTALIEARAKFNVLEAIISSRKNIRRENQ